MLAMFLVDLVPVVTIMAHLLRSRAMETRQPRRRNYHALPMRKPVADGMCWSDALDRAGCPNAGRSGAAARTCGPHAAAPTGWHPSPENNAA
jgi:hypothetical protein